MPSMDNKQQTVESHGEVRSNPLSVLPSARLFPKDMPIKKAKPDLPHTFQVHTVPSGLDSYLYVAYYMGSLLEYQLSFRIWVSFGKAIPDLRS